MEFGNLGYSKDESNHLWWQIVTKGGKWGAAKRPSMPLTAAHTAKMICKGGFSQHLDIHYHLQIAADQPAVQGISYGGWVKS